MKGRTTAETSDALRSFGGSAFGSQPCDLTLSLTFSQFLRQVPPQRFMEKKPCRFPVQSIIDRELSLLGENAQLFIGQSRQQARCFLVGQSAFDFFAQQTRDRKSTRLNSSHVASSYAVFCL